MDITREAQHSPSMSRMKTSAEALTRWIWSGSGFLAAAVRLTVKLSGFSSSVLSVTTNMLEHSMCDIVSLVNVIACCLMDCGLMSLCCPLTVGVCMATGWKSSRGSCYSLSYYVTQSRCACMYVYTHTLKHTHTHTHTQTHTAIMNESRSIALIVC